MLVFILFSTEEKLSVGCFITKQTNKPKTRQPQLLLLLRLLLLTYYYCCYYYKFDTLYHSILLERLHDVFGISGKAFECFFFSYLADRFQSDSVNGRVFSQKKLHYVVPQGSVSGAVLSILYTQPLSDIISRCRCNHHKFADNTQLHQWSIPSDCHTLSHNIEQCNNSVGRWMTYTRLELNNDKLKLL